MGLIIQNSKLQQKISYISGVVPTIPASGSTDHTDGTWLTSDIYVGEFFLNVIDEKVFYRGVSGIQQIYPSISAGTQDVFIYNTYSDFSGTTGTVDKLYITKDTSSTYYWNSGPAAYEQLTTVASVEWNNILNGPSSLPAQIDASVVATHDVNDVNTSHYTKIESDSEAGVVGAKQDKEAGKGLSTNDFDAYYKGLLDDGIQQVIIKDVVADFPLTGKSDILYVARVPKEIWVYNEFLPGYEVIITATDTYTTGATLNNSIVTFTKNDTGTYDLELSGLTSDITKTEGDDHYVLWRDQQTNINKTTKLQYSEANGRMFLSPGTGAAMNAAYSFGIEDRITDTQAIDDGQIYLQGINLYIQGSSVGATGGTIYGLSTEAFPRKDGDISAGINIISGFQLWGEQYPMRIQTPSSNIGSVLTCMNTDGYAEWAPLVIPVGVFTTGSTGNGSIKAINDTETDATGDYSFAGGSNSRSYGYCSFGYGEDNRVRGSYSFVGGSVNIIGASSNGYILGSDNSLTNTDNNSNFILGSQNTISGSWSSAIGKGATIEGSYSANIGGQTNTVSGNGTVTLGGGFDTGSNLNGTADNTVYVPNLNINYVPLSGTSNDVLVREVDGSIATKTITQGATGSGQPNAMTIWSSISGITNSGILYFVSSIALGTNGTHTVLSFPLNMIIDSQAEIKLTLLSGTGGKKASTIQLHSLSNEYSWTEYGPADLGLIANDTTINFSASTTLGYVDMLITNPTDTLVGAVHCKIYDGYIWE